MFARQPGEEVRALGGTLMRARRSGIAVAIVYTEATPASCGTFLPEIRRIFLSGPNGAADEIRSLVSLVREIAPATVFIPSRFEEDPDLRALSFAIEDMLAGAGYDGAAWSYELTRVGEINRVIDISSVAAGKHELLAGLKGESARPRFPLLPPDLVERLRAFHVPGATAAEAFWAVERFEPAKGATSTLTHLARRCRNSQAQVLPRVSVVIRTKDRPRLLEEALGSLAIQDYPHLDVVVVNDGGAAVAQEVERFRGALEIRLVDLRPGRGRSAAANAGIEAARGEWLLMLDDDDLYLAEGIRTLVSAATDPNAVYYGKVDSFSYEAGERRHLRSFGAAYNADLMLFENQIPFIGCLMPLTQVRAVGGVDESLECFEDWDLYLRLAQTCRFLHVDRVVAEYRIFGASFITGKGGESLQEKGLERIFGKHLLCGEAGRLARAQIAVKRDLIPREVGREVRAAEIAIRDRLSRQMAQEVEHLRAETAKLTDQTVLSGKDLFVSVVIVNYNGRHHLEKCLPSLFETQTVQFEVIVVDNGSSDNSVAWMHEHWPQARVIAEQRNLGFGRANLVGIRAAKGNYVALLNSDTVVTPDWLAQLIHPLLVDPAIGATCSQLRLLSRPEILNARGGGMSRLGYGYDVDFGCPFVAPAGAEDLAPVDVLFPSGAAMLMRKGEFLDIGAFDPAFFMYHEDVDLGWRLWLLGKRVVLCPGSIVFHAFGGTTKVEMGASFRDRMGNRHNLRSLWKNYELRNALAVTRRLMWLWLRTGQPGLAAHVLAWNLLHIRGTWRERRRLQRLRRVSDAELFAQGLISDAVPPAPAIPPAEPKSDSDGWIATPHLWPGRASAIGRLGPGWYRPESLGNEPVRATCGSARASLKVSPNASGTLAIETHLPAKLRDKAEIVVTCNGERRAFRLGPEAFWETLEMPVRAGEDGLLQIEIESTPWHPHQRFGNGDLRRLGCVVRYIAFRGGIAAPAYAPRRVSVVITTFNRWNVLQRTLDALVRQSWADFEVIVVDDGSSDGTWGHLQQWRQAHPGVLGLKIFTQENTGQGIARNNGLVHAEGELVLFMGDDIIPEPDFIRQHVQRHREVGMPCAVVGYTEWDRSAMRVTPLLEHVNEAGHQFGYRYMKDGEDIPYTCFYTSNISLPRDILGPQPFDPEFRTYGWEDIELGYKLSKRGLRIVFNRLARARHLHAMTLNDFYRRQLKVGGTISTIYAIHPELMAEQPLMPPVRPPRWLALARHVVPPLLPLLNWLDARSMRMPDRLYDLVLGTGFWIGRGP